MSGEEDVLKVPGKSTSQLIYEAMGNSKKVLVTLCAGLKNNNSTPLINIEESPWSQELKGTLKPSNKELVTEVCRRQKLFAESAGAVGNKQFMMKPKNKPREVLLEWLNEWPISEKDCVMFLTSEAHRIEMLLQAAIDEGRETAIAMNHGAWSGSTPYLRLIHCLTDCDVTRKAYLNRNNVKQREELDAANSPIRPKTGYEIIAEKWNDPDFNPVTQVSSCHSDFAMSIDLSHSTIAALNAADALGIQNRLSNIRVNLLRMIDQWEQSGQGDGGRIPESDCDRPSGWGKLEGRTQEALDNRANFLGGAPSWYLYFWELADTYQLLVSTLQRLSDTVGAPSANATPTVSRGRRDNDKIGTDIDVSRSTADSLDESSTNLHNVLQNLIDSGEQDRILERELHVKRRVNEVNDSIDSYQVQLVLTQNTVFEKLIGKKREEMQKLEDELNEIKHLKKHRNK